MLLTKLHIPSSGNNIIHRTTLFEKLNLGQHRKLILVSAPAGYGKTTLLSDWISQNSIPAAWLSLDNGDNDPALFLSYVISGIQSIHHGFGQGALQLINSPNSPSVESIASLLINEIINIDQNFLLVLDDFHLIRSNKVLNLVAYLLEHIPGNIQIVILTRSDPALSLSRFRSQNQVIEIRSSDLGFSANDISVLFNKKLKILLSNDDAYLLETKTEGWIAGLQLAALSMQGREDISEFIQRLKGDNRFIMDYLMEEVLKIQTDDIKEFLLQTSILEQMSAQLCNVVLDRNDSQLILETLEKNNMFVIPLDTERTWYRYHHLFADLLKQRLHLRGRPAVIELHNKAIKWFNNNSMPLFAIEHAIAAGDFKKSILFLGEIVETMWKNGQHAAIIKYGELLPNEVLRGNTVFCLYYAWILIIAGQIEKAEPFLESAETITLQILNDKKSSEESIRDNKKLIGKISVAYAYLYSIRTDSKKTLTYGTAAMENLSEDDPLWYSWAWYSIGIAEMSRENYTECIKAFENALVYGKKSGNIYLISTIASRLSPLEKRMGLYTTSYKRCYDLINLMKESGYSQISRSESTFALLYTCMAGIETMRTDFDDAHQNIITAYNLLKTESDNSFKVYVLVVYALTLYGLGDIDGVRKLLNEMDDILRLNIVFPSFMALYIAMKGLILVENKEHDEASQFFKENGLEYDNKITYLDEFAYCPYALMLIIDGKFEEAEILLSKLLKMAQAANRTERVIETKVIYAIFNKATGDKVTAILNLTDALEAAASENILMSFILFHSWISDLLIEVYKIQATGKTNIPKKLTDKLKLAIEKRQNRVNILATGGLSNREIDTLKLLANDLSNQEIAEKLFISLNTVKTHVKNILLKLEAENRLQAVNKAKQTGII
jgi:LuxR family transcriptional regulator, maltose regulon positive regulatory protein